MKIKNHNINQIKAPFSISFSNKSYLNRTFVIRAFTNRVFATTKKKLVIWLLTRTFIKNHKITLIDEFLKLSYENNEIILSNK